MTGRARARLPSLHRIERQALAGIAPVLRIAIAASTFGLAVSAATIGVDRLAPVLAGWRAAGRDDVVVIPDPDRPASGPPAGETRIARAARLAGPGTVVVDRDAIASLLGTAGATPAEAVKLPGMIELPQGASQEALAPVFAASVPGSAWAAHGGPGGERLAGFADLAIRVGGFAWLAVTALGTVGLWVAARPASRAAGRILVLAGFGAREATILRRIAAASGLAGLLGSLCGVAIAAGAGFWTSGALPSRGMATALAAIPLWTGAIAALACVRRLTRREQAPPGGALP